MKKNFALCIPTLNRFDLLLPALLLYCMDFPGTSIYIYDNGDGSSDIKGVLKKLSTLYPPLCFVKTIGGSGNIGVAGAWNALCTEAFNDGHHYVLMLNDDIYLGVNELRLNAFIETYAKGQMFICEREYDWSVFLLPKHLFELEQFDTAFYPAYYEDNDFARRIILRNLKITRINFLNPVIFNRSMTLMKQPGLLDGYKEKCRDYYILKWGGIPGEEIFTTPFNKEN